MIESLHNVSNPVLWHRLQHRAFGHVLANQSIGILVESPLPSLIGMGEIDGRV